MAVTKKLDATGLSQVWSLIKEYFVAQETGKGLSANDFTDTLKAQLEGLVATGGEVNIIESVSVNGVALTVTNKGVDITVPTGTLADLDEVGADNLSTALKSLINGKADSATTLSGYGITDAYTKSETYTQTEVDSAIKSAVAGVYTVKGAIAFADLPTSGMEEGWVYNITDAFTTTAAFVEGAGAEYPAGTNVVYTDSGWDAMAGVYDFSAFLTADDIEDLTEAEISAICTM